MRSFYGAIRQVVLLMVSILVVTATYADEPPNPFTPPEARISPPTGVSAQARISPPTGSPVSDARIKPPSGVADEEPSFVDLLFEWLRAQGRIGPHIG